MNLYDQHLHSWHSPDSRADPEENCRVALAGGLCGLTLTEHLEWYPDRGWDTRQYDYAAIHETVERLREIHGSRLFIGLGVEVGYQPEQMGPLLEYLAARCFDLIILSVHEIEGRELSDRRQWNGLDPKQATRIYLDATRQAVEFCHRLTGQGAHSFDVLGHLDLIKRYTHRFFGEYDIEQYGGAVDEILHMCLAARLIPEVNTSTWRQGLPEPMPASWTIQRYIELGGTAVTLGSDAHKSKDVGAGLADAARLLSTTALPDVVVFRQRRPERVSSTLR